MACVCKGAVDKSCECSTVIVFYSLLKCTGIPEPPKGVWDKNSSIKQRSQRKTPPRQQGCSKLLASHDDWIGNSVYDYVTKSFGKVLEQIVVDLVT